MFQKSIRYFIYCSVSVCLLAVLTACTGGKTIENLLGADPQLKQEQEDSQATTEEPEVATKNSQTKTADAENNSSLSPSTNQELVKINLPENFPQVIPIYPQAELLEVAPENDATAGQTTWRSPDNPEQIVSFYQQEFQTNQWEIRQNSPSDSPTENTLTAIKDDLEVVLSLNQLSSDTDNNSANTELIIEYQLANNSTQQPTAATDSSSNVPKSDANSESIAVTNFSDLNETPEQLRQYVKEVAALGILTPYQQEGTTDPNNFAPNQPVTRRDYARWLVSINNHFYANSSGNKIHLAIETDQPAFQDIGINDPHYPVIQGLAEAGLIPSRLTGDDSKLLFQPDSPLTREDLITWKVPLDLRKALPPASLEAIADSWGFQDVNNVNTKGLRALFADFQNGEQANIRRIFGYTTLFQPKKPVTRAEAAASLWYLGFQGDGINAKEASKLQEN